MYLYAIPTGHVRDIFVKAIPDPDYASRKGELNINMELEGSVNQILFCLLDQEGKEAAHKIIDAEEISNITITVDNINMWSAEMPYLYDLEVELLNDRKETIEIVPVKVGFRRFEIIDKIMCLNGKRILFKGVNRHEFNAFRGRAITKEDMLWDIRFLKQNNINAVRTSHYPNNSMWYRLCDMYGIYLMDETNLESHGSWQKFDKIDPSWNVPGNLAEWKENVVDRAQSMFERDENHPSVLIWSCGNESYAGEDILAMSKLFKEKDNTRLVHYEGVFHNRLFDEISDMESRMYAKPAEIEEYLKNNPPKPYISCEYMHAMGNSCGGMHLYIDLEKKYSMYQGGFIWDYIDQAIFRIEDDKEEVLSYGGDFDDRATDYGFCTNGLVYAYRRPSPKVQEVKYLYQNVKMSIEGGGLRIKNDNLFTSTDAFDFVYWIQQEDQCLSKGMLKTEVCPGEEKLFMLPEINFNIEGEYTINVSMRLKENTLWATKGYEIAFAQKIEGNYCKNLLAKDADYIKVVHGDGHIGVRGKSFSMLFSKKEGGLVSLIYDGNEYITRAPKTSYWRALTDNDRGCRLEWECAMWQNAGAYQKIKHYQIAEENNERLTLVYTFEMPTVPVTYNTVSYTVVPSGKIFVTVKYKGNKNLPKIPVFAMDFKLKKEMHFFKYYGMGPEENYADRKEGARLGIFSSDAVSNYSSYLVPQECGNRTGVRWLQVTDGGKKGLYFSSQNSFPFEMSVLPYSAYELENALHKEELPKINYTWVRIAGCQMGVGGDDSWGAPVHEEYCISSDKELEFTFCVNRIQ